MKIAYIMLCHKNPKQINFLIKTLSNNSDFYIHVDKKSDIHNKIDRKKNVIILENDLRVDVQWGENGMIVATLNAISVIKNSKKKYDYIWLISGQDFPIKNNKQIQDFLTNNIGMNFIEVFDGHSFLHNRYKKRNEIVYLKFMLKNNIISKIIRNIYIVITGGYNKTYAIFKRKPFPIELRYGSQWWTLTYDCCIYIYDYIKNNETIIMNFFEKSIIPDECLFQTIFMSSPYASQRTDNLVYVDWSENKRSPKTLGIADYQRIKDCDNKLFARKFDFDKNIDGYSWKLKKVRS